MEDLLFASIAAAARQIASRAVSPVELTEAVLERAERIGPKLRAFTALGAGTALEQAREAEASLARGERPGPLHGIPVSIKDIFHVKDMPLTAGSRFLESFVSDRDASVVARLRRAGAVIFAKTNLHEFAFGTTCTSSVSGTVANPWHPERIAGGSSGGSAAALASGLGFASIGSDSGGSVRIPAAFCGVVGLKPTYERIPREGLLELAPTLDHVGVLGRRVGDVACVLDAIAGAEARAGPVSLRGLRIGLIEGSFRASDEVNRLLDDAVAVLQGEGARVRPVEFAPLAAVREAARVILFFEAGATHRVRMREHPERFFADVHERLEQAASISEAEYHHALSVRGAGHRELDSLFESCDLLVSATVPMEAPPLAATSVRSGTLEIPVATATVAHTREWNVLGCPAVSVPCGFTPAGLPVGMQLVARHSNERALLDVGTAYQRLTPWHERRPTP